MPLLDRTARPADAPAPAPAPAPAGRLELIVGPMFACKTSELQRRVRRHALAGRAVLVITHASDVRYADAAATTHDGASVPATRCERLRDARRLAALADVVAVDEIQFFPDAHELLRWVRADAVVIACGLCADYAGAPFLSVCELLAHADEVVKLAAVCTRCGRDAGYTRRTAPLPPGGGSLVGGAEAYEANCRACWAERDAAAPAPPTRRVRRQHSA